MSCRSSRVYGLAPVRDQCLDWRRSDGAGLSCARFAARAHGRDQRSSEIRQGAGRGRLKPLASSGPPIDSAMPFAAAGDTKLPGDPESPPNACGCRLIWRGQRMTLGTARHTVGRDPNADIYLDSTSVSRRHASIRIADGQAMLEDLGSKNGTFVGKRRIDSITALADGDRIRIGSIELTFRIVQGVGSTRTSADEA